MGILFVSSGLDSTVFVTTTLGLLPLVAAGVSLATGLGMDAVLAVGGFDLSHALTINPDFLGEEAHVHLYPNL